MSKYPVHEKLKECAVQRQAVGDFIEWLNAHGYAICIHRPCVEGDWFPTLRTRDQLIADHFEIDMREMDAEKEAMLEELRRGR